MNKNYDFASKRTLLILLFICLVFFLLIVRAFDYLPDDDDVVKQDEIAKVNNAAIMQKNMGQNLTQPEEAQTEDNETEESNVEEVSEEKSDNPTEKSMEPAVLETEKHKIPTEALIPIEENSTKEVNIVATEGKVEKTIEESDLIKNKIERAEILKQNGEYDAAIETYKSISWGASTMELTAKCYEEMANIYAIQKKFGSALVYAQKANKIEKTPSREKLIQTLLQKTGMQTSTKSN